MLGVGESVLDQERDQELRLSCSRIVDTLIRPVVTTRASPVDVTGPPDRRSPTIAEVRA
jgi:hypothetical protein